MRRGGREKEYILRKERRRKRKKKKGGRWFMNRSSSNHFGWCLIEAEELVSLLFICIYLPEANYQKPIRSSGKIVSNRNTYCTRDLSVLSCSIEYWWVEARYVCIASKCRYVSLERHVLKETCNIGLKRHVIILTCCPESEECTLDLNSFVSFWMDWMRNRYSHSIWLCSQVVHK